MAKLKIVVAWLAGVPTVVLATTNSQEAAQAFIDLEKQELGEDDEDRADMIELYSNIRKSKRKVFRSLVSPDIVHETYPGGVFPVEESLEVDGSDSNGPEGLSVVEDGPGTGDGAPGPDKMEEKDLTASGDSAALKTRNDEAEVVASQNARDHATSLGIEIASVRGTGNGGMITKTDVTNHSKQV